MDNRIRKIIHIDMDAFYASVEQRDHPRLKGKPVAVGGSEERGVVAAASYEARRYGVKSAMPSVIASRRCPGLIFVPPRFEIYRSVSQQIRSIFLEYTDLVEPLSLDEAYLDVSTNKYGLTSATLVAQQIKKKIKATTQLTASAGISYCKFLAKTASDVKKPDGLFVILPEEAENYLSRMPIHQFHGIGKVTAEKMKTAGIFTGGDLRKKSLNDLHMRFGKIGAYYFNISRGIDNREVQPDRERKSVSAERTFDQNIMQLEPLKKELSKIAQITFDRYHQQSLRGRTVVLKVKYGDFRQITRSESLEGSIQDLNTLTKTLSDLVDDSLIREEGIRLLGVGISNFSKERSELTSEQLTLDF